MRLILILLFMIIPKIALSGELTLQWDANTDADLSGYRLYQTEWTGGTTSEWVKILDIEKDKTAVVIDIDLTKNYIWYLTAFDVSGNESQASNIAVLKDKTPPNKVLNLDKQ